MLTPNWYNRNANRKYPLADSATAQDDRGARLPDGVLADCQLRWPLSLGHYAYLGGVTVSAKLVTLTFLATDDPDGAGAFSPLASITVPRPVQELVNYPVVASQPGVGGFVAFGDLSQECAVRFTSPRQSLLVSRAAAPYPDAAIASLGKRGRALPLTGIVTLKAGPDILLTRETLTIDGEDRDAIVVSLKPSTTGRNVFEIYAGPCAARPESHNCQDDGVETINGVAPDCDGNLDIVFVGMETSAYADCGGEILEVSLGLPDVCPPDIVADFPGFTPCDVSSLSSSPSVSQMSSATPPPPAPQGEMPYLALFDTGSQYWSVLAGEFDLGPGDSPEESSMASLGVSGSSAALSFTAGSVSRRNVALVSLAGYPSRPPRRLTTQLSLPVSAGTRHNGGIVFNYQDNSGSPFYWMGALDIDNNRLILARFRNGLTGVLAHTTLTTPAALGDWFELTVTLSPGTVATVHIRNLSDPDWPAATVSATLTDYAPTNGGVGLEADHSEALFSLFKAEVI